MSPSTTPGFRRLHAPSSFTDDAGLRPLTMVSPLPTSPPSDSRGGYNFGASLRFALAATCRFVCPPVGADSVFTSPTGTFTAGLSAVWSPAPPPTIATGPTGQVSLADLSSARTPTSFAAQSSPVPGRFLSSVRLPGGGRRGNRRKRSTGLDGGEEGLAERQSLEGCSGSTA